MFFFIFLFLYNIFIYVFLIKVVVFFNSIIFIFHIVGTAMEIYKTATGSWIYPEPSLLRIGGVPLFSGFMYAAIGSYITRAWRLFDFRFEHHPARQSLVLLSIAIYINFFSHHFVPDARLLLFAASIWLFGRTTIYFKVWRAHRHMPLLLANVLSALFVWLAENIGTLTKTWLYPHQVPGWSPVSLGKLGSWYLLLVISYAMVALINRPQEYRPQPTK